MPGPADDEIEICLLGRGNGECVAVHLLNGRWIVVDSFNRSRLLPAAKWYLESIDVPGDQVELIALTHFHADHHRGIAELHDWCPTARLATTAALGREQFRRLRVAKDAEPVLGLNQAQVGGLAP